MAAILHILTDPNDPLPKQVVEKQAENDRTQVKVIKLDASDTNYHLLLHEIFRADSVQVW